MSAEGWRRLCIAVGLGLWCCLACKAESTTRGSACGTNHWGYRGLPVHDLLRTAARRLIRAGVSEQVTMAITSHRISSMFHRCNFTTADDKVKAMAALGGAEKQWAKTAADQNDSKTTTKPKKADAPAPPSKVESVP